MINTSTNLPPEVQSYFCQLLLSTPTPDLVYGLAAESRVMPSNSGNTFIQSRYNRIEQLATTPLDDIYTPPGVEIDRVDIAAKVQFYGMYAGLSQTIALQNQDPVLNKFVELLGLNLRMTEDRLLRNTLLSSASVYYCQSGNNGDDPTELTYSDVLSVITTLQTNNAYKILDSIEGQDRFGTSPVYSGYLALGHTNLTKTLFEIPQFTPKWNYPNSQESLSCEQGALANTRFMLSSVGAVDPNASAKGQDVYITTFAGLESYMKIEQDNFSANLIYLPPQFSGPLARYATIGYTTGMAQVITNDQWLQNVYSTL